ncbi:MAG: ATP-binding protein [Deltaproteobacteria bacterium]|jgi:hypothetical protein|nr:ATP-binding protein [Deltaproteobacteria bacterium]
MKRLPVGIVNFEEIRQKNCFYADKTRFFYNLLELKAPYFLSRPRRFGKSLTLSVLKAILEGRRELFQGLWIDGSDYDWTPYPVIHLSLIYNLDSPELVRQALFADLKQIARRENISIDAPSPGQSFKFLIENLRSERGRPPAILIDEYDSPILNNLAQPEVAEQVGGVLTEFFGALKTVEESRGFIFITGVTKFAKVSIFSELNNLVDLTLHRDYADICGFTISEFDALFQERLEQGLENLKFNGEIEQDATAQDLRKKILDWYDGYSWNGRSRVLNPWSLLNFFHRSSFINFWVGSGKPTFLHNLAKDQKLDLSVFNSNNYISEKINVIDLDRIETRPLMFQAGYLTIRTDIPPKGSSFSLVFPNLEVKEALINLWQPIEKKALCDPILMRRQGIATRDYLFQKDALGFQKAFQSFLSNFTYRQHIAREAYYHTLFIVALAMADQGCEVEGLVGDGQFDLQVKAPSGEDFIIEIKYINDPKKKSEALRAAIKQIEDKNYIFKFQGENKRIWKTALVINRRTEVYIIFEEAENWGLEYNQEGYYSVPQPSASENVPEDSPGA